MCVRNLILPAFYRAKLSRLRYIFMWRKKNKHYIIAELKLLCINLISMIFFRVEIINKSFNHSTIDYEYIWLCVCVCTRVGLNVNVRTQ